MNKEINEHLLFIDFTRPMVALAEKGVFELLIEFKIPDIFKLLKITYVTYV